MIQLIKLLPQRVARRILDGLSRRRASELISNFAKFFYSIIYSEKFDLETKEGHERVFSSFESFGNDREMLLKLFTIMIPVLKDRIAIEDINYSDAAAFFIQGDDSDGGDEITRIKFDLVKLEMGFALYLIGAHIAQGKKQFNENRDSLKALVYDFEKMKKGPISKKEFSEIEPLGKKLEELYLKAKSLNLEV